MLLYPSVPQKHVLRLFCTRSFPHPSQLHPRDKDRYSLRIASPCIRSFPPCLAHPYSIRALFTHILAEPRRPTFAMFALSPNAQLSFIQGIFPYEYVHSFEQMRQTPRLPEQADFFSTVANSGVNDRDYEHACSVFTKFGCKNLLEYCELYCKLDVLLLAECFLQFREEVFLEMGLDCW